MKDIELFLEEGYGSGMGFNVMNYLDACPHIHFVSNKEAYTKDFVTVLRAPEKDQITRMKKGAILLSMLHYDTRPIRNKLLEKQGIIAFSMDGMIDDFGIRHIVDYYGTAFNGAEVALKELMRIRSKTSTIHVSIIGVGEVGLKAIKAFKNLSNTLKYPEGLSITVLTRSLINNETALKAILNETDILVDATSRVDTTKHILDNKTLGELPLESVILDLTADPYDEYLNPIQVKGFEGIPTGTLDKYVIYSGDSIYKTIPKGVDTTHRRVVVSCNAWPGVHPKKSMEHYGKQLIPFMRLIKNRGFEHVVFESASQQERILKRSQIEYFKAHGKALWPKKHA
ncbi:alanine dehydrogenase [Tepidibacter hydrothermalis]|uniref:Alanine dehydrogenase n=1 Tax=Tepidibacter hydrothermalis TaxID=3036126 RepID=A0ABY8ED82_9FIRM|nr:alanine dehydrogenase [Tepidibacter hydrothermalis]WFD10886.1 alanine dehydrogenase [Tepidibacter hydrothermalis]